jgi:hypothetical protein
MTPRVAALLIAALAIGPALAKCGRQLKHGPASASPRNPAPRPA